VGGRDCGGHDRLDVSCVLAWGVDGRREKGGKPFDQCCGAYSEVLLLESWQLTRRRRMNHRSPTKSKELAEIKAVASL